MALSSLYKNCLQKVSLFLKEKIWKAGRENNPFKLLPSKIIRDLMTSIQLLQHQDGFRPDHFELLLTSGMLPELKLQRMDVRHNLERPLVSLVSACQNLKVLILIDLEHWRSPGISEALEKVLINSLKLEVLKCDIHFDLRALRKCTNLRSVELNFWPEQPWYNFLQVEKGCFQNLSSLELFAIPNRHCLFMSNRQELSDYILVILKHCPALASLGPLGTTLAQLYLPGFLPYSELGYCHWRDREILTKIIYALKDKIGKKSPPHPELTGDAILFHSFVKELEITLYSEQSIPYLSNLKNLIFLDITINVKSDVTALFGNVLEEIGIKLKHLKLTFEHPVDISALLKKCPNLKALGIISYKYPEHFETGINLPNLKYLTLVIDERAPRLLSLFSNCHNLSELFMLDDVGFDYETLHFFLKRNSLSKLKIAFFENCSLTTRGFKEFFLNAPELRNIIMDTEYGKYCIKRDLCKVHDSANCDERIIYLRDEFFGNKPRKY